MKHGYASLWRVWIICCVGPGISRIGFGMAVQGEYFDYPFPNRLPVENLFEGYALAVGGINPVQFADYVFQFFDVVQGLILNRRRKGPQGPSCGIAIVLVQGRPSI